MQPELVDLSFDLSYCGQRRKQILCMQNVHWGSYNTYSQVQRNPITTKYWSNQVGKKDLFESQSRALKGKKPLNR